MVQLQDPRPVMTSFVMLEALRCIMVKAELQ